MNGMHQNRIVALILKMKILVRLFIASPFVVPNVRVSQQRGLQALCL